MPDFRRFAVYDPGPDALARAASAWLGWDAAAGQATPAGGGDWTLTPRRYGFHATVKAPFRLADDRTPAALEQALAAVCARLEPVLLPQLTLTDAGGFLALMPAPQPQALTDMAAEVVRALDDFRAPLTDEDIARRCPDRLTAAQRANLLRWGYPHVMDEYRYHMTLTGDLDPLLQAEAQAALAPLLAPVLPAPHPVAALALAAEDADGRFHLIARCPLGA